MTPESKALEPRYLHIGFGLANCIDDCEKFDYQKIESRVKELGVEHLINKTEGKHSIDIPDRFFGRKHDNYLSEIEKRMWIVGDEIKKIGIFSSVTLDDIKNAINFLELFTFYTAESKAERYFGNKEEQNKLAKTVNKAINRLEKLNSDLQLPEKQRKSTIPPQIATLIKTIDKEFSEHLTITEQKALSKKVNIAKEILKSYAVKLAS